jgi:adenine phosphoribosyltransferase
MELADLIRDVPDFPVPGILFKDITTLISNPKAFRHVIDSMAESYADQDIEMVTAVESRGFIFGAPLAYKLGAGIAIVRKPDRLPAETISETYTLEYGSNVLEMHQDAIEPGQRVLVVDDLLATGGSVLATINLVERLKGDVIGVAVVIELDFLNGREKLADYPVMSLIHFD